MSRKVRRARDRDAGTMAVYAAVVAPGLFMGLLMFINATARWNSWRDANAAAEAAARAAVQVTPAEFDAGARRIVINPSLARQRASAALGGAGLELVSMSVSDTAVTVEVSGDVDYVFPMGGFGSTVAGSGRATLQSGVTAAGG